jgi:hypothetical protein
MARTNPGARSVRRVLWRWFSGGNLGRFAGVCRSRTYAAEPGSISVTLNLNLSLKLIAVPKASQVAPPTLHRQSQDALKR